MSRTGVKSRENDIYALLNSLKNKKINLDTFSSLINSGNYDLKKEGKTNAESPIIWAIKNANPEAVLELIRTNKSNPEYVTKGGNTALILACREIMPEVALALIRTGKSIPEQINKDGDTALFLSCINEMSEVALELIKTGKSRPEQVKENVTALILACDRNMPEVAIALINTGQSRPEHIDNDRYTALMYACITEMPEVAIALINTGQSRPEQVNYDGNTALLFACGRKLSEVALALIRTGKSVPEQVSYEGDTALELAKGYGLTEVAKALTETLNELFNERSINLNASGFNQTTQETSKIIDFLRESTDNICLKSNKSYFLTSKQIIKKTLLDSVNIKYGCKKAGDDPRRFAADSNIIHDNKYLNLSPIIGLQALVDYYDMQKLVDNKTSSNLFYITPTDKKLASIISQAYIDGGSGASADHCGTGKKTTVYSINTAQPICGTVEESEAQMSVEPVPQNEIKIQYKGTVFSFPITETNRLGEIKNLLLQKLVNENSIASINQNVKFIYKGKIYTDDSIIVSSLENPPFGITLQSMISPKTGGRKTRKHRGRKHNRNTCTKNYKKR